MNFKIIKMSVNLHNLMLDFAALFKIMQITA